MSGVVTGFGVITTVVVIGYMLGRLSLLGPGARDVLSALAFYVAGPALMFTILLDTDLSVLWSGKVVVSALSVAVVVLAVVATGLLRRWGVSRTTMSALASSYVNAGNLGLPIASYVLGDASLVAPILLTQMLVMAPVAVTVLDLAGGEVRGAGPVLRRALGTPVRNPLLLASLAGVTVSAVGWSPPAPFLEPFGLIGGMAVPAMLLAFGISLHGSGMPGRGPQRGAVLFAVSLKSVVQPLTAWALGALAFDLSGPDLFAVVVLAALPTAQNVFTYSLRFRTEVDTVRDTVLISTFATVPVLFAVTFLLG
ncbi:AEC family transporter [Nocardiopsis sp. CC223A]|uniref:AEC family transporter n=1 Tax=Nocardiopsis sp. CC223A TaxID=3044051 RepID=UPI00278BEC18|nr:AEC family transporter [Nocardiopsis sp. CC223A]